jgi:hypothetical protein
MIAGTGRWISPPVTAPGSSLRGDAQTAFALRRINAAAERSGDEAQDRRMGCQTSRMLQVADRVILHCSNPRRAGVIHFWTKTTRQKVVGGIDDV